MDFKISIKFILFYCYLFFNVLFNGHESKLIYNCKNNFSKFGNNCYFLSIKKATWQEAYFECKYLAKGSKLVVLSREVEDYNMRKFLNYRNNETEERWIGGIYDWNQNQWKWASSGHKIRYNNFETMTYLNNEENKHWQCIALNPNVNYKWNADSCLEKKYFVCETKPQPECTN